MYPQGIISGYFGNLTRQAVEKFQCAYGIVCFGVEKNTGHGRVGPQTALKLNELITRNPDFIPQAEFNLSFGARGNAVKILQEQGWSIPEKALKQGIEEAFWPGRFQVVSKKPFIVVDCAHNPEGIHVLADVVKKIRKRHLLLLATAQDKDSEEMVHIIAPLFKKVIVTEGNYRAKSAEKLGQEVQEYVPDVEIIPECRKAVQRALSLVQKDELFLVTGSIYMVGEALQYLKQQGKK